MPTRFDWAIQRKLADDGSAYDLPAGSATGKPPSADSRQLGVLIAANIVGNSRGGLSEVAPRFLADKAGLSK